MSFLLPVLSTESMINSTVSTVSSASFIRVYNDTGGAAALVTKCGRAHSPNGTLWNVARLIPA
jgi:hypothetical protein